MKTKHLMPYTLDEALDYIQTLAAEKILQTVWNAGHFPHVGYARKHLVQLEDYVVSQHIALPDFQQSVILSLPNGSYASDLHKDYGLLRSVLDSAETLNHVYINELSLKMSAERKQTLKELLAGKEKDRSTFGSMFESYIMECTVQFYYKEDAIQNIRNNENLRERIESLHGKLLALAQFYESVNPPEYYENANSQRAYAFFVFAILFDKKNDKFWKQSSEMKKLAFDIFGKHY